VFSEDVLPFADRTELDEQAQRLAED
jgi:hypothetical protein